MIKGCDWIKLIDTKILYLVMLTLGGRYFGYGFLNICEPFAGELIGHVEPRVKSKIPLQEES